MNEMRKRSSAQRRPSANQNEASASQPANQNEALINFYIYNLYIYIYEKNFLWEILPLIIPS
jgi:hypothetical protein